MAKLLEVGLNLEQSLMDLNHISDAILRNVDPDVTKQEILTSLNKSLKTFAAITLEIDVEGDNLVLKAFTQNNLVNRIAKLIPFDIFALKYPLKANVKICKCVREDKVITSPNLSDFFYPVFKNKALLDKMQKILRLKMCLGMPVKANGKVIGAFFVISKREEFTKAELMRLQFFANFSGIASLNYINIQKLQERYEAEKEIAAIMTHELKTPIAIAYNSVQLLEMTLAKYEKNFSAEFIAKLKEKQLEIRDSIMRMNRVCNSIFSLTEVENHLIVDDQKLDLAKGLEELVAVYQRFEKKGVSFSYSKKIIRGVYYGPGIQFLQVVSVILENAFKYTHSGKVTLELVRTAQEMRCTITDTGPGISEKDKEKVFDRFYRSKGAIVGANSEKGLGLGLYIAKKITEKSGGELLLEDNPAGKGTRFVIKFPVYKKRRQK